MTTPDAPVCAGRRALGYPCLLPESHDIHREPVSPPPGPPSHWHAFQPPAPEPVTPPDLATARLRVVVSANLSARTGLSENIDAFEAAARADERARAAPLLQAIESNGHYCDGMTTAWTDAQAAEARAKALEDALRLILTGEYETPPGRPGSFEIARAALRASSEQDGE